MCKVWGYLCDTTPQTVLWDVTSCSVVQIYGRFGWNCCLQFQDRSRSRFLRNVSRLLPDSRLHTPRSRYSKDRLMCSCSYRVLAWVVDLILQNHKDCIWKACFRPSLRSMDPDDIWSFWPLMYEVRRSLQRCAVFAVLMRDTLVTRLRRYSCDLSLAFSAAVDVLFNHLKQELFIVGIIKYTCKLCGKMKSFEGYSTCASTSSNLVFVMGQIPPSNVQVH